MLSPKVLKAFASFFPDPIIRLIYDHYIDLMIPQFKKEHELCFDGTIRELSDYTSYLCHNINLLTNKYSDLEYCKGREYVLNVWRTFKGTYITRHQKYWCIYMKDA